VQTGIHSQLTRTRPTEKQCAQPVEPRDQHDSETHHHCSFHGTTPPSASARLRRPGRRFVPIVHIWINMSRIKLSDPCFSPAQWLLIR
jgi:hypothetical protein